MTEPESSGSGGSNWLAGCGIAAAVVLVLMLLLVAAGVVGAVVIVKRTQAQVSQAMAQAAAASAAVPDTAVVDTEEGESEPGEAGEEDDEPYYMRVVVKLAGVGPRGVRYTIVEEDEEGEETESVYEGDEALVAALKEMVAGEGEEVDPNFKLVVDLDVATAAGITQAQVDAAVKACWAAGAGVMPPPDLSKEKPPAEAPRPGAKSDPPAPPAPGEEPKEAVL